MTTPPAFQYPQVTAAIRSGIGAVRQNDQLFPRRAARRSAAHRRILAHCRQHIPKSLNESDYLQAAAKSRGAYPPSIKAIGSDHQLRIARHAGIIGVAGRLASLVTVPDAVAGYALSAGLAFARSLHQHFYEHDLSDAMVIASSNAVTDAIALLQRLPPPEPAR